MPCAHGADTGMCACWGRWQDIVVNLEFLACSYCIQIKPLFDNITELINESPLSLPVVSVTLSIHSLKNIDSALTVVLQKFLASRAVKRVFYIEQMLK